MQVIQRLPQWNAASPIVASRALIPMSERQQQHASDIMTRSQETSRCMVVTSRKSSVTLTTTLERCNGSIWTISLTKNTSCRIPTCQRAHWPLVSLQLQSCHSPWQIRAQETIIRMKSCTLQRTRTINGCQAHRVQDTWFRMMTMIFTRIIRFLLCHECHAQVSASRSNSMSPSTYRAPLLRRGSSSHRKTFPVNFLPRLFHEATMTQDTLQAVAAFTSHRRWRMRKRWGPQHHP